MKILFKQSEGGALSRIGVRDCYFKRLSPIRDNRSITKKAHHHRDTEVHMVTRGSLTYEIDECRYTVCEGQYLLICPTVTHRFIGAAEGTQKYAVTFSHDHVFSLPQYQGALSPREREGIALIERETAGGGAYGDLLAEGVVAEFLVGLLRRAGLSEGTSHKKKAEENTTLTLAKSFIRDNVERNLSVAAVAAYCYLSPKQLTRIFERFEDTSPARFITKERLKRIKDLLSDSSLSLAQISERMHFSSEYYFSTYFKKHAGLPPGQYRKMLGL